jgi:hypothetical protein
MSSESLVGRAKILAAFVPLILVLDENRCWPNPAKMDIIQPYTFDPISITIVGKTRVGKTTLAEALGSTNAPKSGSGSVTIGTEYSLAESPRWKFYLFDTQGFDDTRLTHWLSRFSQLLISLKRNNGTKSLYLEVFKIEKPLPEEVLSDPVDLEIIGVNKRQCHPILNIFNVPLVASEIKTRNCFTCKPTQIMISQPLNHRELDDLLDGIRAWSKHSVIADRDPYQTIDRPFVTDSGKLILDGINQELEVLTSKFEQSREIEDHITFNEYRRAFAHLSPVAVDVLKPFDVRVAHVIDLLDDPLTDDTESTVKLKPMNKYWLGQEDFNVPEPKRFKKNVRRTRTEKKQQAIVKAERRQARVREWLESWKDHMTLYEVGYGPTRRSQALRGLRHAKVRILEDDPTMTLELPTHVPRSTNLEGASNTSSEVEWTSKTHGVTHSTSRKMAQRSKYCEEMNHEQCFVHGDPVHSKQFGQGKHGFFAINYHKNFSLTYPWAKKISFKTGSYYFEIPKAPCYPTAWIDSVQADGTKMVLNGDVYQIFARNNQFWNPTGDYLDGDSFSDEE